MATGKTITLTRWAFVGKVMSVLFNMLSRLVIAFLPRNKCLLISWQQSPFAVILEPKKIRSLTVSIVSPPGLGRCPGEGNGYRLQYTCLENSKNRGDWQATAHGVDKSQTWLSDYHNNNTTFVLSHFLHKLRHPGWIQRVFLTTCLFEGHCPSVNHN